MTAPVRVGDTVRRARAANTDLVQRVLRHLELSGVEWAPRAMGVDALGREVVSWIAGTAATSGDEIDLLRLAGIVRQLHDLTAPLVDGGFECVVHDDLQPRNVVVRDRAPVGLVDWEQARPGRRVEDVAKLCWSFVEPRPGRAPADVGARWRHLTEVYGLDGIDDLVSIAIGQMASCAKDIERGVAQGSARHEALAERGDDRSLRAMHAWTIANEEALRTSLGA